MHSDFCALEQRVRYQLVLGHPVSLKDTRDIARIEVERGTVWFTQSGRHDDVFLKDGESTVLTPHGRGAVFEALTQRATMIVVAKSRLTDSAHVLKSNFSQSVRAKLARLLRGFANRLERTPSNVPC